MPEPHEPPFKAYLRQVLMRLRGLSAQRRDAIRRELLAHLADAADEAGAHPGDPAFQRDLLATLGPAEAVAAQLVAVHGGAYQLLRRAAFVCGVLGGALALLTGPLMVWALGYPGLPLLLSLLLHLTAGALGLGGVLRHAAEGRRGLWWIVSAVTLMLAVGLAQLYGGGSSYDALAGLGLLIPSELLLIYLAVHAAELHLPRLPRAALVALALLLVSFVAPLSALPNPLGALYIVAGGHRYAPGSPLVNRFATMLDGDPAAPVRRRLDELIGETGLSPLDPQRPLVGYELRGITSGTLSSAPVVRVALRYAGGEVREVEIAAYNGPGGDRTGIDSLTAQHLSIPVLPPAGPDAPLTLGEPARLALPAAAERLAVSNRAPGQATTARWSPDGRALLVRVPASDTGLRPAEAGLWVIGLSGEQPRRLADEVGDAQWSADSSAVVAVHRASALDHWTVTAYDLSGGARTLGQADRSGIAVVDRQVYFVSGGALWRAAITDGLPERVAALPQAHPIDDAAPLAVAPDGRRVAYRCWSDLCVADGAGRLVSRVALGFQPPHGSASVTKGAPAAAPNAPHLGSFALAWSPDGERLALTTAASDGRGLPALRLLTRDGEVASLARLGPDGPAGEPQWHPSGEALIVMSYPLDGRRIVAVDAASGAVVDLSRPRWDALASLSPSGQTLLLWNGNGDFWVAPAVR